MLLRDQLSRMKQRAKPKRGSPKPATLTPPFPFSPSFGAGASSVSRADRVHVVSTQMPTVAAINALGIPGIGSGAGPSASIAKSLWEQAVEKLTPEDRSTFNFNDPDKRNTLLEVIGEVKNKKEQCVGKQWKFLKSNGEEVILRNIVDSLLTRLDKYAIIGDIAIQQNPGGGVALAWAGFRFLLQIVLNDTETWANIFTALEYITHTLSRCAIYEFLYIRNSSKLKSAQRFVSSLPDLYASILKYLCSSKRFFGSNTAARILKGVLNPYNTTFRPLMDDIKSQEARVEKDARVAAEEFQHSAALKAETQSFDNQGRIQKLQRILEEMQLPLSEIKLEVIGIRERIRQGFESQEIHTGAIQRMVEETNEYIKIRGVEEYYVLENNQRLEILMWLSEITSEDHHSFVCSNRLAETGGWLLQKPEFSEWGDSMSSSILWLHGIAGAGKTKLASFVVDTFRDKRKEENALAFFYCNYKESERRDPECILRAIVKQLSTTRPGSSLPESLITLYQERKESGFKTGALRLHESENLILKLTESFRETVIVIDALDECEKDTRGDLLHALQRILKNSRACVKVFVTSRDDDDIILHLDGLPNIYIKSSDNYSDIQNFVKMEVERCIREKKILRGFVGPALKDLIISTLINGAHGMFLWAHLQILSICKEKTVPAIEKALTKLPSDLRETFSEILLRIEDQTSDSSLLAMKTLVFMMCARRPLSPAELLGALRIKHKRIEWKIDDGLTEMTILDVCQNLVVIDDSEKFHVLRFAHLSVQDFLKERFDPSRGHAQVAEICLTFLCWPNHARENPELEGGRARRHALANYSHQNWMAHVKLSGTTVSEVLMDLQKEFLGPGPAYTAWCSNWRQDIYGLKTIGAEGSPVAPLLVACYYGLLDICKYLLNTKGVNTSCKDELGRGLLSVAAARGDDTLVELLLQVKGMDINSEDDSGSTPLVLAARWGHIEVVRLLLGVKELDINHKGKIGRGQSAIAAAIVKGNIEVAWLLLHVEGADPNIIDNYGYTPLWSAVAKGNAEVVRWLIRTKKVDINHRDPFDRSPLRIAVENRWIGVLKVLLRQEELDVNSRFQSVHTPLSIAADKGYDDVIELLLQVERVDADCVDHCGWTPLWRAAERGHFKVASQLLRAKRVDINHKDLHGQTPLFAAVKGSHGDMAKVLLDEEGVDVNFADNFGFTPLLLAACEGRTEMVQQLLRAKDIDVSCVDRSGCTPLLVAAKKGHGGVVKELLRAEGVDVNCKDQFGQTPLSAAAAMRDRVDIVNQLLQEGDIDLGCVDSNGYTPLSAAVEMGNTGVVKVLLKAGEIDVNYVHSSGLTLLLSAVTRGHTNIVIMLLQTKGIDVNFMGASGCTPLSAAVEMGYTNVVWVLLNAEKVDVNRVDNSGRTPLFLAAMAGFTNIVKLLLQAKDIDVNRIDNSGCTPLSEAVKWGYDKVVTELLRVGGI